MTENYTFDAKDAIGWQDGLMPIDSLGKGCVYFRNGDLQFGRFDEDKGEDVQDCFIPLSPRITPVRKDAETFYGSTCTWLEKLHLTGFFKADPLLIKWWFAHYNRFWSECLRAEMEAMNK